MATCAIFRSAGSLCQLTAPCLWRWPGHDQPDDNATNPDHFDPGRAIADCAHVRIRPIALLIAFHHPHAAFRARLPERNRRRRSADVVDTAAAASARGAA